HAVVTLELLRRDLDHLLGAVDPDQAALRKALEQLFGHATGADAGVDHRLARLRLEALEHLETPAKLGLGDLVIGFGVPPSRPAVHRLRAHSEVVTGPASAFPAASNSSIFPPRSKVIATSSRPFESRCLMSSSISNGKTPSAQLTVWSSRSM